MKITIYKCPVCHHRIIYEKSLEKHIRECWGVEVDMEKAKPLFEKITLDISPEDVSNRYLIKSFLEGKDSEIETTLKRKGMMR